MFHAGELYAAQGRKPLWKLNFGKTGSFCWTALWAPCSSRRGCPPAASPELLNRSAPEWIASVSREYALAGSQVVYANTFGANRRKLAHTGHSVQEIVTAGVTLAKQAVAGTPARVALDMGPLGELLEPMGSLRFEEAYALFGEMARCGAAAGPIWSRSRR